MMKMKNMKNESKSIQQRINKLNNIPERDANLAHHSKTEFIRQIKIQQHAVTQAKNSRLSVWKQQMNLKEVSIMKIASILVILGLLFGGSGATVAAAQTSMPGDMLYPVKMLTEDIQMDLTNDEANKFELAMKFTQRRYDEIQAVLEDGGTPSEEMVAQYQQQIKHNLEIAVELDDPTEAVEEVHSMLQNQNMAMTQTMHFEEVEPFQYQMQSMMQYHLQMIEENQENIEQLKLQMQNQFYFGEEVEPFQNQAQSGEQSEDGLTGQHKNNPDDNGENGIQGESDNGNNGNNQGTTQDGNNGNNGNGDNGGQGGNGGGTGGGGK